MSARKKALQIFNDAQVVYKHALGPQDRQVLFLLQRQVGLTYSLGSIFKDMGALQDARGINEQAIANSEESLNWDNPRLVNDLSALSKICAALGDYPAALTTQERVLE